MKRNEINCILSNNLGYNWYKRNGSCFKGYLFLQENNTVLRKDQALDYLYQANSLLELEKLLDQVDGVFSFIINKPEITFAGVDVARSMPLYYSEDGLFLSDNIKEISGKKKLQCSDIDLSSLEEIIIDRYIAFDRTIYNGIKQLDAGQVAEFYNAQITVHYYYTHKKNIVYSSRSEALNNFNEMSEKLFDEILKVVNGRPIVLSLSGGYDSRYIACMLKKLGKNNDISCYSYGKANSFEVKKAKQIADTLGFRWTFVEYTKDMVNKYLDGTYNDYFKTYQGLDCPPYIQNFVAVSYLHEIGWFKKESVFITGLCNDMQTGYYTKRMEEIPDFKPTMDFFTNYLISDRHFTKIFSETSLQKYKEVLSDVIQKMDIRISNYQEFVSAVDTIEAIGEHSRVFLHMNDVHAFFGYEWLIPCWSKLNLNFWYSQPSDFKVHQNLYEEWQLSSIPKQLGVAERKTIKGYSVTKKYMRYIARTKLILKRIILYPLGISLDEDYDVNYFDVVIAKYFKNIKQKYFFGFRNLALNNVLVFYLLEQELGTDFIKKLNYKKRKEKSFISPQKCCEK